MKRYSHSTYYREPCHTQEKLNQLVKDNEDLKMEVRELLSSTALATETRDQGAVFGLLGDWLGDLVCGRSCGWL